MRNDDQYLRKTSTFSSLDVLGHGQTSPLTREQLEEEGEEGERSVLHYSGAPVVTPVLRHEEDIQVGFDHHLPSQLLFS